MKIKQTLILTVGLLFLIVLLQNAGAVNIRFLFWELSMSGVILLPLIMLIGFVFGFIIGKKP